MMQRGAARPGSGDPDSTQCDIDALRRLIDRIYRGSVTHASCTPGPAAPPDFHYIDPDTGTPRTIPGAQFQRPYHLRLHTLELTFRGYAVRRRFDGAAGMETAFSTHPPPRWRRLLEAPLPLALRIDAGPGGVDVGVRADTGEDTSTSTSTSTNTSVGRNTRRLARGTGAAPLVVRLDPAMQEALLQARGAMPRPRPAAARALAWLTRWFTRR